MRALILVIALATFGCGRQDGRPLPGEEGGACYGNGTCNARLHCSQSDLCVRVEGRCTGSECDPSQHPDMVAVEDFPGGPFLIDIYEASVQASGAWGSADQDDDDDGKLIDANVVAAHASAFGFEFDDDGGDESVVLTTKVALSQPGAYPAHRNTFYQAMGACANAGKRLCTRAEWVWACQGGEAFRPLPYGTTYDGGDEPGVDCWTQALSSEPQPAGTASACRTPTGIYDMSGNVPEWTHYVSPSAAGLSGGGIWAVSLASVGCNALDDAGTPPSGTWGGFRCCLSL